MTSPFFIKSFINLDSVLALEIEQQTLLFRKQQTKQERKVGLHLHETPNVKTMIEPAFDFF